MPHRVLIADADTITREAVGSVLTEEGYDVVLAANGEEALRAVARDDLDLVLTALDLPSSDGNDVAFTVLTGHPKLPVVVLTAHALADAARLSELVGAQGFVNKPIDLDDVVNSVHTHLPLPL